MYLFQFKRVIYRSLVQKRIFLFAIDSSVAINRRVYVCREGTYIYILILKGNITVAMNILQFRRVIYVRVLRRVSFFQI